MVEGLSEAHLALLRGEVACYDIVSGTALCLTAPGNRFGASDRHSCHRGGWPRRGQPVGALAASSGGGGAEADQTASRPVRLLLRAASLGNLIRRTARPCRLSRKERPNAGDLRPV